MKEKKITYKKENILKILIVLVVLLISGCLIGVFIYKNINDNNENNKIYLNIDEDRQYILYNEKPFYYNEFITVSGVDINNLEKIGITINEKTVEVDEKKSIFSDSEKEYIEFLTNSVPSNVNIYKIKNDDVLLIKGKSDDVYYLYLLNSDVRGNIKEVIKNQDNIKSITYAYETEKEKGVYDVKIKILDSSNKDESENNNENINIKDKKEVNLSDLSQPNKIEYVALVETKDNFTYYCPIIYQYDNYYLIDEINKKGYVIDIEKIKEINMNE